MTSFPETWRDHEWTKAGQVALVPLAWVMRWRNPDAHGIGRNHQEQEVGLAEMWDDICRHGMRDPLVIRVGVETRTARLETGNHRVQVFCDHGVKLVPVVIELAPDCRGKLITGDHSFPCHTLLPSATIDANQRADLPIWPDDILGYANPCDVFAEMKLWKMLSQPFRKIGWMPEIIPAVKRDIPVGKPFSPDADTGP